MRNAKTLPTAATGIGLGCHETARQTLERTSKAAGKLLRRQIAQDRQLWRGLELQTLLTPYSELIEIVQHIHSPPGTSWIDLGAAYGRLGIVLGLFKAEDHFLGYEYAAERVEIGNALFEHLKLPACKLRQQDLSAKDFRLEPADCYFLYDFGTREKVEKTLSDLKSIASQKPITVIARGRRCRNWIDRGQPWLFGFFRNMLQFI